MKNCARRNCNNTFEERGIKTYCSRKCKQATKDIRLGKLKHRRKPYIKFKKTYCENCKFVALHSCQLDIDHINGNHKDNDPSNLQTLCANCHRLKTFINKDWESN